MSIYVARNGAQLGPFAEVQIREMLVAGDISLEDLAWAEGRQDWEPLRTLIDLAQPPPVPAIRRRSAWEVSGPQGVGGWLTFFCVGLTILNPLISAAQIVGSWPGSEAVFAQFPSLRTAIIWENLTSAAIVIYGFITGCLIWSRRPKGRTYARRFLLIDIFGIIALEAVALWIMSDLPQEIMSKATASVGQEVARLAVYFTIWWLYFKKSVRVRNTYGEEPA